MRFEVVEPVYRSYSREEWNEIISRFEDQSLIQTWEYGEAKAQTGPWEVDRAVFLQNGEPVGAVQAMVRKIPVLKGGLVWINRGPLWRRSVPGDLPLLASMMRALRERWVGEERMYLRVAPPLPETETDANMFQAVGFPRDGSAPGWASSRVDLSQPVEVLRRGLHQKWRNCLNKAERLGLSLESSTDGRVFDELMSSYETLLRHRGFQTSVTPGFLRRLQQMLPCETKLRAFAARLDGELLGGAVVASYGETCEYIVGTNTEESRRTNAGQFVLWQALCHMKDLGYRWFDLGGMDPQRTPEGIYHFKAGIQGTWYRLIGEYEAIGGGWHSRLVRRLVRRARGATGG